MNKNLVKAIETARYNSAIRSNQLVSEYELIKKEEPENIKAQNAKALEAQEACKKYMAANKELKAYKALEAKREKLYKASLIYDEGSEEYEKANAEFMKSVVAYKEFEDSLAKKYGVTITVKEGKTKTEEPTPVKSVKVEAPEKFEEKKKSGKAPKIIAGVLAVAAAAGLGYGLSGCTAKNQDANVAIVDTDTDLTEEELTGKYGQFKDATNDEQVKARAQYIYDNYYSNWVNELTPEQQKNITPEKIANIIRVMNGELPLDEDGNRYYDVNVVDETVNSFVNITANLPSSSTLDSKTNEEIGQIKDIPMHMFAVDGSETSEFIKPYDEDFTNIIDGRNHHNGEKTVNAIKSLGEKMWREFVMVGRNYQNDDGTLTNYRNPYDLPAQQRALAWIGATQRYGAIALPYNLNGMQAVCIDVCVNYNTKELNAVPVNEIYEGYHSGLYSSIIARLAGLPEKHDPDTIGFVQDLNDQLEFKYKELKQMTLK